MSVFWIYIFLLQISVCVCVLLRVQCLQSSLIVLLQLLLEHAAIAGIPLLYVSALIYGYKTLSYSSTKFLKAAQVVVRKEA